jgi:hypothetical protein
VTTYLTWLVPDGGSADVPEKVRDLRAINAKGPKAAAEALGLQCGTWGVRSVVIAVVRADLLHRWVTFARRYVVRFTRVVAETRRLP